MHAPKTFILTSVLALFSTTSAAPAPAETTTTAGCSALTIVYSTVEKPFALTALPDDSIFSWSVFLRSTSASQVVEPYISLVKLPLPSFRLTNGTLTTGGADSLEFPAFFGPTIDIFPPVLQPLQFGGPSSTPAEFYVKPSCDVEDNGYLELRATQPLVVRKLGGSQNILGKPEASEEVSVFIHLNITGDVGELS